MCAAGYVKNLHKPGNHVLVVHGIVVHPTHAYPSLFVRKEIMKAEYEKEKVKTRGLESRYRLKMLHNDVSVTPKPYRTNIYIYTVKPL